MRAVLFLPTAVALVAPGVVVPVRRSAAVGQLFARKKSYYDYRRTNDGETYEEIMGLPPPEDLVGRGGRLSSLRRRLRRQSEPAAGQTHYQNLHQDEIDNGIAGHLRDLGHGSEMELDPSAFTGKSSSVRLTSTEAWAELETHARVLRRRQTRSFVRSWSFFCEESLRECSCAARVVPVDRVMTVRSSDGGGGTALS